jgi:hypothetical protein
MVHFGIMTLKLTSPEVPVQLRPAEHLSSQDIRWPTPGATGLDDRQGRVGAHIDYGIALRDTDSINHAALMAELVAADSEAVQAAIAPVHVYMSAFKARAEGSNRPLRQVGRTLYKTSRLALRSMILPNGEPLDDKRDQATLMVGLLTIDQSFPALAREVNGVDATDNHNLYPLQMVDGKHIKTPLVAAYSEYHDDTILPGSKIDRIHLADIAAEVMVAAPGPHELLAKVDARHMSEDPAIRAMAAFDALAYGLAAQVFPGIREGTYEALIQQTKRLIDQQVQFIQFRQS